MINIKAALENDVVELNEDLPEYGFKRGQRAVIIEAFENPTKVYDLEFENEAGDFLGFAYGVRPDQITSLSKELFTQGVDLWNSECLIEAERKFQQLFELTPTYRGVLLNLMLRNYENDWSAAIPGLLFLLRLAPDYGHARDNLAIAYLNYGVQKANEGDRNAAIMFFSYAIRLNVAPDIIARIQENFAGIYTNLGIEEFMKGNHGAAIKHMSMARVVFPSETTGENLALAHAHLARFFMSKGDYQEAISAFEGAEEIGLILPDLLNDYGIALVAEGRLAEASRAFERALKLQPESYIIKTNLAKLSQNKPAEEFVPEEIKTQYIHIPAIAQQYQQAA
ncbi:MAG: tetratricopeptide repeat protein [Pyrinomonadaceae bacterium]